MKQDIEALKQAFRAGRHTEAIAECEALCVQEPAHFEVKRLCAMMHALVGNYARSLELLQQVRKQSPEDADVLFNIGTCQRELRDFKGAADSFKTYTEKFSGHADGWASLAESKFHLNEFKEGVALADRAIKLDSRSVPAWTVRGNCQKSMRLFNDALASFTQAIQLAPDVAELRIHRGDTCDIVGDLKQAAADYTAALALTPNDSQTLEKATHCLLQLGRGKEGIRLCREILKLHPDNLTAKLGAEWLLSKLVPVWHLSMMNEEDRNRPYYEGLKSVVTPDKVVFEIGTGSGLLAMMAAKLGAQKVFTCEAVSVVADTASKIIERNNFQDRIKVLAKPSYAVQLQKDLPERADILVHEIFSSELLGEHVLPAIEDAKARLLKPGGEILPSSASIMIALVGGDELGKELHVGEAFGFDLRLFNAIHPKKRPIHREDLPRVLLTDDTEAFRFDFCKASTFPAEKKRLELTAVQSGLCYGVIQWIRFELGAGIVFENHPAKRRPVANWQHTIYCFDEPLHLEEGSVVTVNAMHDRSRPWFDLAIDGQGAKP
ncbi:tetratricopeptide repeat protein [Variovorax sp. J22P168]|uniref:tetratricopeptide repeat protein n=1 Tax=Variovorax jilinensis TaxID=3053513 RepID=UPI0025768EEC|nr:tetratricopeptide repeat protein [Variovorax sp. J22P168]MDM0012183.1 tetratricopeptide repeat protein [Variovorax sp. J22P168]